MLLEAEEEILLALRIGAAGGFPDNPTSFTDRVYRQVMEYLGGERRRFEVPYALEGTPFQRRILSAAAAIPYGRVSTYGEVARAAGFPGACRAAGNALGRNPIWLIIPCHRVVGAGGKTGGYAGGTAMKKALLALESAGSRTEPDMLIKSDIMK